MGPSHEPDFVQRNFGRKWEKEKLAERLSVFVAPGIGWHPPHSLAKTDGLYRMEPHTSRVTFSEGGQGLGGHE